MTKQSGSAHIIIIIALVVALVGALGFIVWQNVTREDTPQSETVTTEKEKTNEAPDSQLAGEDAPRSLTLILNSKEIIVDVADSKYTDITATFNEEAGYYHVYSKDLLARVNAANGNAADFLNGCNTNVIIDTFKKDQVHPHARIVGEANGNSVHVGFLGPCQPTGDDTLNEELYTFRDYITEKVKSTL